MFWSSAGQRGWVGLLRCWSLSVNTGSLTAPRCTLYTSRLFSISAASKCPTHEELKQWALEVSPFSTVRAQLGCSISVRPLDPHAFPEADRAFITVHGTDTEQVGLDHLNVHYDDQNKQLLISAEKVDSHVTIDLAAPIKSSECLLWNTCWWKIFLKLQHPGTLHVYSRVSHWSLWCFKLNQMRLTSRWHDAVCCPLIKP